MASPTQEGSDDSKYSPARKGSLQLRADSREGATVESLVVSDAPVYRIYKRRWIGVVALFCLNVAAGMNWLWFAPISVTASKQFGMSLTRINWLNNSVNLIYLPVSFMVPTITARYGIRKPCVVAAIIMTIGAWIRYAGTPKSLSPNSAYALLFIGQVATGIAQPWFQILGPRYSEVWFDLAGRTTGTAIIAISNPVGSALGELISPLIDDVRTSVLILAIITTVLTLTSFFIIDRPPTPPTFAGSQVSPSLMEVVRATIGKPRDSELRMSKRQRMDFAIVTILFSTLVGAADAFFILVDQIFNPYGYSNDSAGNMGGALIVAGIIGAIVTAPLFDRVFTKHLGLVAKILVPILSVGWLCLIWDVRPHNYGGLYPVFIVLGAGSFILLPVALEIGVEITSSAESSSAVFWCGANLLSVIFVEVMDALRDGDGAHPPQNMKRGLVFLGVTTIVLCFPTVFALQAKQVRREVDANKAIEARARLGREANESVPAGDAA